MRKLIVLLAVILCSCGSRTSNKQVTETPTKTEEVKVIVDETKIVRERTEPETLKKGSVLTLPTTDGAGNVTFTIKDIKTRKLSDGKYNLVLSVLIKNNVDFKVFISDLSWKLTDTDMVEIEESGIYDPMFSSFTPGSFFFTIVDAGFGKQEEVGYHVSGGTYYLFIAGKPRGKIIL